MVVRLATGEITEELDAMARVKDDAKVSLGRQGGLKGGKARAESLTPEQRKKIAQDAANKRWKRT